MAVCTHRLRSLFQDWEQLGLGRLGFISASPSESQDDLRTMCPDLTIRQRLPYSLSPLHLYSSPFYR